MVYLDAGRPAAVSGTAPEKPPAPRITGQPPWWSSAPFNFGSGMHTLGATPIGRAFFAALSQQGAPALGTGPQFITAAGVTTEFRLHRGPEEQQEGQVEICTCGTLPELHGLTDAGRGLCHQWRDIRETPRSPPVAVVRPWLNSRVSREASGASSFFVGHGRWCWLAAIPEDTQ